MSGAADLRNDIAGCLDAILGDAPHPDEQATIDALLALVPKHAAAILNLIGDVREGWRTEQNALYPVTIESEPMVKRTWERVFVVRPRREAT